MSKKRPDKVYLWLNVFVIARHAKGAATVLRERGYEIPPRAVFVEVPRKNAGQAINARNA